MQPLPIRGESTTQSPQALSKSLTSLPSLPSTSGNQTTDSQPIATPHLPPRWALRAVPRGRRAQPPGKGRRNREKNREKGAGAGSHLRGSREKHIVGSQPGCSVPGTLAQKCDSETGWHPESLTIDWVSEARHMAAGGASQRGGRTLSAAAAGRSLALSSSGAPRMIRAGQSRSRPCVPPGSGSRTKGERAWQHLGERKAVCGSRGIPLPHCTASNRRWHRRDCMVLARRRVQPAARLPPCRGLRAPADSWGRWRRSRDAPGSAPPPRSLTLSPTSRGYRTARARRGQRRLGRGLTGLSRPAQGHLPLKPAGRPRPFPAPSRWGSVGGPPRHVLRASPPTALRARPLPRRPPAPPGAGRRGARANSGPESDGGGANANRSFSRPGAGNLCWKSLPSSLRAPTGPGLTFP